MSWSKEYVENLIERNESFNRFIDNGVCLPLQFQGTVVLFYAGNDDRISVYYAAPWNRNVDYASIQEFCNYAIPYLNNRLSSRRWRSLNSIYCVDPVEVL